MGPFFAVFLFTVRQIIVSRKIWLTLLLLLAPSVLMLVVRSFQDEVPTGRRLWEMYHIPSHFFLLSTLVPLICLVHGVGLIGADVETRTITYLITRKLKRGFVLLAKFLATALVLAVLCDAALILLHYCTLGGMENAGTSSGYSQSEWSPFGNLTSNLLMAPLACVCYLAVFTCIGLLSAKPLNFSILYFVIIEMVMSNLPLHARAYTVIHQIRKSLAGSNQELTVLFELPQELAQELYPAAGSAFLNIGIITVMLISFSVLLMTKRELLPTKLARE